MPLDSRLARLETREAPMRPCSLCSALFFCAAILVPSLRAHAQYIPDVEPYHFGVLVVTVQDEQGHAIQGARIGIINRDGEEMTAISKADGRVKGEACVEVAPFSIRVVADQFIETEVYGVYVSEGKDRAITVTLKKAA
jgi:hypothetical protein